VVGYVPTSADVNADEPDLLFPEATVATGGLEKLIFSAVAALALAFHGVWRLIGAPEWKSAPDLGR
jgi:hypothetical protein